MRETGRHAERGADQCRRLAAPSSGYRVSQLPADRRAPCGQPGHVRAGPVVRRPRNSPVAAMCARRCGTRCISPSDTRAWRRVRRSLRHPASQLLALLHRSPADRRGAFGVSVPMSVDIPGLLPGTDQKSRIVPPQARAIHLARPCHQRLIAGGTTAPGAAGSVCRVGCPRMNRSSGGRGDWRPTPPCAHGPLPGVPASSASTWISAVVPRETGQQSRASAFRQAFSTNRRSHHHRTRHRRACAPAPEGSSHRPSTFASPRIGNRRMPIDIRGTSASQCGSASPRRYPPHGGGRVWQNVPTGRHSPSVLLAATPSRSTLQVRAIPRARRPGDVGAAPASLRASLTILVDDHRFAVVVVPRRWHSHAGLRLRVCGHPEVGGHRRVDHRRHAVVMYPRSSSSEARHPSPCRHPAPRQSRAPRGCLPFGLTGEVGIWRSWLRGSIVAGLSVSVLWARHLRRTSR